MNTEERRAKVIELLKECVNSKLIRGDTQIAIKKAFEAYELASEEPMIPAPWPQLAAYRLGHLRLRSSAAETTAADLEEIDQCFSAACYGNSKETQKALGPLPYLYDLAVLHRMLLLPENANAADTIRKKITHTFQRARELIHSPGERLQDAAFNLLELAAYFLGEDYGPLEGLGALDPFPGENRHGWFLAGSNPEIERILATEEIVMAELASRAAADANSISLRLGPEGAMWRRPGKKAEWERASKDHVRLLVLLLQQQLLPAKELRDKLSSNVEAFRKIKQRTREQLRTLVTRADLQIFKEGDPVQLTNELTFLAAVHKRTYRF